MDRHVVVLGAGVLGAVTAARLARRGASVTLVTSGEIADGASGRSLAWLNSFGRIEPDYHRLRVEGLSRYRALASSLPRTIRLDGQLCWRSEAEHDSLVAAHEHMLQVGYPATWLRGEELACVATGVDLAAVPATGAVHTPSEGWVDLPGLIGWHLEALRRAGGTVRIGAGSARVDRVGGRTVGIALGDGSGLTADAVVLATGAAVPADLARLGVTVPDSTVIGLLVRTHPVADPPRLVLNTPKVSMRPTPDGGLCMDSAAAGPAVIEELDGSLYVPDEAVERLLHDASRVLRGHPTLTVAAVDAGPKPIPGDGRPVVGAVPGLDGVHVAFAHSGATVGLVVGDLLADEVLTGVPSPLLARFRPDRFVDAGR